MNIFDNILFNSIILLFPIILGTLYNKYNEIYDSKKINLFEDFTILTSFYLLLKFNDNIILINLPLILAYLKKNYNGIGIISTMCIFILSYKYNDFFILFIIEYIFYYLIYLLFNKKSYLFLNAFIILKIFIYLFISTDIVSVLSFIIISYIVLLVYYKVNSILIFEKSLKEIEKEKNLRLALFKITHEIKNPITVCKGYLDMFDVKDQNKSQKYVDILQSEISRLLILLEDFLSINKIQIEKDIIDLNLLLEDTTNNFIPLLKEKHISKLINISKDELYINADYNRLKQVLINVIKNSIESIKTNGLIKLSLEQNEDNIKIILEDNGVGMNNEELKQIKQPFFTTKNNGTGLGIYLSNQIINAHNGTIEYISKENVGTKTIIKLPYEKLVF